MKSILHLLLEHQILPAKINNYIYRNKNYRYIEQKMREKLFPMDKVSEYLETYRLKWESLLTDDFLARKIKFFKQKGKSNTYIVNKLWETKLDREKLEKILSEDSDDDSLQRELGKILKSITPHPNPFLSGEGIEGKNKSPLYCKDKWRTERSDNSEVEVKQRGLGGELSYKEKQKLIEKLLRKWFKYGDIKKVLDK